MKKQFNSRVEESLLREFKSVIAERGVNIEEGLEDALRQWMNRPLTKEQIIASKLSAFYYSEDGGPAERGFRQILRDLIEDKL